MQHVEMDHPPLDDDSLDRLLSGQIAPDDAPPGLAPVAALFRAASGPASPDELADEVGGVAAGVEVIRASLPPALKPRPSRSRRPSLARRRRRSPSLPKVLSAKVAALTAIAFLGAGTAAAAATGHFPVPKIHPAPHSPTGPIPASHPRPATTTAATPGRAVSPDTHAKASGHHPHHHGAAPASTPTTSTTAPGRAVGAGHGEGEDGAADSGVPPVVHSHPTPSPHTAVGPAQATSRSHRPDVASRHPDAAPTGRRPAHPRPPLEPGHRPTSHRHRSGRGWAPSGGHQPLSGHGHGAKSTGPSSGYGHGLKSIGQQPTPAVPATPGHGHGPAATAGLGHGASGHSSHPGHATHRWHGAHGPHPASPIDRSHPGHTPHPTRTSHPGHPAPTSPGRAASSNPKLGYEPTARTGHNEVKGSAKAPNEEHPDA